MSDYFVTIQLDTQRTADIIIQAPCAYDARTRYNLYDGRHRIIAIRPCKKEVEG